MDFVSSIVLFPFCYFFVGSGIKRRNNVNFLIFLWKIVSYDLKELFRRLGLKNFRYNN